jgi:hypothetical protein
MTYKDTVNNGMKVEVVLYTHLTEYIQFNDMCNILSCYRLLFITDFLLLCLVLIATNKLFSVFSVTLHYA